MKHEPRLIISYVGSSSAVQEMVVSPKAAARRWPELFRQLARDVAREAERVEARQETLPGLEGARYGMD